MAIFLQKSVVFICLMTFLFIRTFSCEKNTTVMTKMLRDALKNYDKRILPSLNGEPVDVNIQVYLLDMVPVTRYHMHYSIEIFFRQIWRDYRLILPLNKSDYFVMASEAFDSIWIPEAQFPMAKKGSTFNLMKPNLGIHIHQNGWVFLSRRVSLTLFCPMDLHNFPFDRQICKVPIQIFSYNNNQCTLRWGMQHNGPIYTPEKLEIFEFKLENFTYGKNIVNHGSIGSWDRLWIQFLLKRDVSFYVLQYITPCCLIVILSWVGFWIDYKATPARASLGITTVLTITTLTNSIRSSLPNVAYTKSIDIYLLACFLFVFASMVEFAIVGVTHIKWRKSHKKTISKQQEGDKRSNPGKENKRETGQKVIGSAATNEACCETETFDGNETRHRKLYTLSESMSEEYKNEDIQQADSPVENENNKSNKNDTKFKLCGNFFTKLAEKHTKSDTHIIDRKSRLIFPILFLIFNIIFFVVCINMSSEHKKDHEQNS